MTSTDILRMLDRCLQWADEHDDIAEERFNVRAFEQLRRKLGRPTFEPSPKQTKWIEDVHEKLFDEPQYQNAFSAGQVPRGNPVPTPAVLTNLPKRPPQRRKDQAP